MKALGLLTGLGALAFLMASSKGEPATVTPGIPSKDDDDGIDIRLLAILERAREMGAQFRVVDGLRTVQEQTAALEGGASKYTSDPKTAPHVLGLAVDLWPLPDPHSWQAHLQLARTMAQAAQSEGAKLRWGGSWKVLAIDVDPEKQAQSYALAAKDAGKKPLVDPAHYEIFED